MAPSPAPQPVHRSATSRQTARPARPPVLCREAETPLPALCRGAETPLPAASPHVLCRAAEVPLPCFFKLTLLLFSPAVLFFPLMLNSLLVFLMLSAGICTINQTIISAQNGRMTILSKLLPLSLISIMRTTLDNLYCIIFYTINNTIRIIYSPAPIRRQITA